MALLGFCLILASLALGLALMAVVNSFRTLKLLRSHSVKSVLEISAQQAAHASALQSLSTTVKRLSSRYGMAEKRGANGKASASDDIDRLQGAEWKAAMRSRLLRPGQPVKHSE